MNDTYKPSVALLATDTIRGLYRLFKGKRYPRYHVRAVFADADHDATLPDYASIETYSGDGDMPDKEMVSKHAAKMGLQFIGYAVYADSAEPVYVTGDELPYLIAKAIATILNHIHVSK